MYGISLKPLRLRSMQKTNKNSADLYLFRIHDTDMLRQIFRTLMGCQLNINFRKGVSQRQFWLTVELIRILNKGDSF